MAKNRKLLDAPSVSPPPDPDAMFATGSIYANVETHSDEAFAKVASAISERWAQATDPDYQIKKLLADVSHVLRHDPPYPDGIREDANIAGLNANMLRHALETQADRKSIAWLALEAGYRWAQFDARVRYEPAVRKPKEDRRKKGNTRKRHLTENERRAREMLEEKLRAASQAGKRLPKLTAAATQIGIERAEELNRRDAEGRIDPFGYSTVVRWLGRTRELFSRFNREKS